MSSIQQKFLTHFNKEPMISVKSPGRINLIGEHTDYNNGYVLPAAIDKSVRVALNKRPDSKISMFSVEFNDIEEIYLDALLPVKKDWPNYILGVADQLLKHGYNISGFNIAIDGDVPIGAGLSSSAALECAVIFALNELFQLNIDKKEMVLLAQKAEHEFAGVQCGIMDQFASMFGKKGQVIKLDCQTLDYEYFPLELKDYAIVLFDTQVKHALAGTEYNQRRQECQQGIAFIQQQYPQVKSLRDATLEQVETCLNNKDKKIYDRCKYVVEEIQRLLESTNDLKNGNLMAFGKKMFATHHGLSKLYQVSCPELDILVDAVKDNPFVIGARMMGGGFGGCTINIVKIEKIDDLIQKTALIYHEKTGKTMKAWKIQIENGTHII